MTEREIVLRERAAFKAGWYASQDELTKYHVDVEAPMRYPLPKITRPRIVEDPHSGSSGFWRGDGEYGGRRVILYSTNRYTHKDGWLMYEWGPVVTHERCKLWADLLANPNEIVEDGP